MSFRFSPSIIKDGLVLYLDAANSRSYAGTGTVWTDLSKSNNNGVLTNGPTFNSSNLGSIVFDGIDDYVNISNYTSSSDYTLSCWVYYNTTNSDVTNPYRSFISKGSVFTNDTTFSFGLRRLTGVNNNPALFLYYTNGATLGGNEYAMTVDPYLQWYNFSATKSGTAYTLYINGNVFQTFVSATVPGSNSYSLRVGGPFATPSTDKFFNGRVSNVQIYNRALSASEVLQNYNTTRSRFNV